MFSNNDIRPYNPWASIKFLFIFYTLYLNLTNLFYHIFIVRLVSLFIFILLYFSVIHLYLDVLADIPNCIRTTKSCTPVRWVMQINEAKQRPM